LFPLRDENPLTHPVYVTYLIIGLNIAVWVFVQGLGFGPSLASSICRLGLVPGELLGTVAPGTTFPLDRETVCVIESHPSWITLMTSMFMHGGWLHIIGNMWFLAIFGDNIEDAMGSLRFVLFYLVCGTAAAAAQIISSPDSAVPMVGASGAIGGVMGAYAVLFPRAPVHMLIFLGIFFTRIVVPAFLVLGYWFLLQLLGGVFSGENSGGVAVWAHVGGFAAGVVLIKIFCKSDRLESCRLQRGTTNRWVSRYGRD
jgi:membrane associated rhomboid family serine protease